MPPALNRVEEASLLLVEASDMLRADPYSAAARKKLIEGSRGSVRFAFYTFQMLVNADILTNSLFTCSALFSMSHTINIR